VTLEIRQGEEPATSHLLRYVSQPVTEIS